MMRIPHPREAHDDMLRTLNTIALRRNMLICDQCEGSGFSGNGTSYGDVCGKCGGQGGYPDDAQLELAGDMSQPVNVSAPSKDQHHCGA